MRIQSFRVGIDRDHEAVAEELHDGLNVIEQNEFSHVVGRSLADRLFGQYDASIASESFTRADVSLTNHGTPVASTANGPAALADDHVSSADLPLLREMYCVTLNGRQSQWLQSKRDEDMCLCGRIDCDSSVGHTSVRRSEASNECRRRLEQARTQLAEELKRTREISLRREQQWRVEDHRLSESITQAHSRIETLREELRRIEAEIEQLGAKINGWKAERQAINNQRQEWHFTSGLTKLESQLAEYDGNLIAFDNRPRYEERQTVVTNRCDYLRRASGYLRQLTGGYLTEIIAPKTTNAAAAINRHGDRFAWDSLSISGRNLVKLALSLAAAEGWEQHGLDLPLVVEDPFANLKPSEVGYVIDVLKRFSSNRRQVLLFADREITGRYFADQQVRVRGVSTRRPAPPRVVVDNEIDTEIDEVEQTPEPVAAKPTNTQTLTPKQRLVAVLRSIGIDSTIEFLEADPHELVDALATHGYTAGELIRWQDRIAMLHFVPELSDDDLAVLIACDCDTLEKLSTIEVDLLHERMIRFLRSDQGSDYRRLRTRYQRPRIRDWRKLSRRRRGHWSSGSYGRRLAARSERRAGATNSGRSERSTVSHSRTSHSQAATQRAASSNERVRIHERVDHESETHESTSARFYLDRSSPIVDAPSIGPKMAERLEAIGIHTVADLLASDAETIAAELNHSRTKAEHIDLWQKQASLMCRVPQLRGHDAQILVALDYLEPDQIANMSPSTLFAEVEPFSRSKEGKRIIRTMTPPDLEEVTEWIEWTQQARSLKAA